jgi:hypothetical protein
MPLRQRTSARWCGALGQLGGSATRGQRGDRLLHRQLRLGQLQLGGELHGVALGLCLAQLVAGALHGAERAEALEQRPLQLERGVHGAQEVLGGRCPVGGNA